MTALAEIATLQPDGWWQIDRDAILTSDLTLTTELVRVVGRASIVMQDSARLDVWGRARLDWGPPRTDARALAYSAALLRELGEVSK